MSKVICVHFKKECPENLTEKLKGICKKIEPDNISANEPIVLHGKNCASAIMNPMQTVSVHEASILLGNVLMDKDEKPWHSSQTKKPDGSYALFRNNPKVSEFVTDSVASRTIWYYFDEEKFLAGTSQRALILFLENFEFDDRCIPWMLSTGSLGPEHSWDKRISRVRPATTLVLDKEKWEIKSEQQEIQFKIEQRSATEHRKSLEKAIGNTFNKIQMNLNNWVLPLSGGYDSRGILYFMLKEKTSPNKKPRTITWGLEQSQYIKGNDANVAKKISEELNLAHKYYHTDISDEPLKTILERFISLGEGRIDHIGGYMDGFKIWKTLFEDGVQGTIRGDEGFGWVNVSTSINVRYYNGCALCSDFTNLNELCKRFGIPTQQMPPFLEQRIGESLSTWRDRMYHEYRLPTVLASLSDLKLGYVEQSTPLLSNNILKVVRELPDKLRTEKLVFKKIVDSLEPKIEYANKGANAGPGQILKHPDVVDFVSAALTSEDAKSIFPQEFLETVIKNLKTGFRENKAPTQKQKIVAFLKRSIPKFMKNYILSNTPLVLDYNLLAFRLYIIVFMHRMLSSVYKNHASHFE